MNDDAIVMSIVFGGIILYYILRLYFEHKQLLKQIEHGVNIKRVN